MLCQSYSSCKHQRLILALDNMIDAMLGRSGIMGTSLNPQEESTSAAQSILLIYPDFASDPLSVQAHLILVPRSDPCQKNVTTEVRPSTVEL